MNVQPDINLWGKIRDEFEGCELKAYKRKGDVWTIGYGTTYLYDKARKIQEGDEINMDDAIRYMGHDSAQVIRYANLYIKSALNPTQSTAICDYIYNRGIGNFLSTQLDELINANPEDGQILMIIKGTGLRDRLGTWLAGLARRRKMEAYLYQTGLLKLQF